MTSSDVSLHSFAPLAGPLVLLLTHRRGGAVLALSPAQIIEQNVLSPTGNSDSLLRFLRAANVEVPASWQDILEWLWSLRPALLALEGDFGVWNCAGVSLAMSRTTTAEHLAAMYGRATQGLGLDDAQVSALVVGVGPGSFTGLRIGCAFANGLACGRPRSLWAARCESLVKERELCIAADVLESWNSEFAVLERGQDESFAHVNLLDVILGVVALVRGDVALAPTLEPAYGREPGPVLKLREQNKASGKV